MTFSHVNHDSGAGVRIGKSVVVGKLLVTRRVGNRGQSIRLEIVGLSRHLQRTGVSKIRKVEFDLRRRRRQHLHVETRVVRHQGVGFEEQQHFGERVLKSRGIRHHFRGDAVHFDVASCKPIVRPWRAKEQCQLLDNFALPHPRQTNRAWRSGGTICGLKINCGEVQRHPSIKLAIVALTIGIVGLPNVGKSTLFNALTKNNVLAANYPFATIEPNVGVVNLPDVRLDRLAQIFSSERILPAPVSFVDIAGIVRGASVGEGLGNQFLANIREADAIAQVVRGFTDSDVVHVDGRVDAKSDIETINTELILADLQTLEKARPRVEKEVKGKKVDPAVLEVIDAALELLNGGTPLSAAKLDISHIKELGLLTAKPTLYVFNVDEAVLTSEAKRAELAALVAPSKAVFLDAKVESELIDLEPAEASELLASLGQDESGLDQLARIGFTTLGLQTYLTAGPKESRAWTIRKGWKAPQAAGVIHTDFERGFIKAEVVSFADLDSAGSMNDAKAAGKVRMEGKDYVMQDGDVVEFRFNV